MVTIGDNDATTVSVAANDPTATETTGNDGEFTISLSDGKVAPTGGLTVTFTVTGTATNGTDYGTISTTALIPAGQSSVIVPVASINDDNIVEGNESVVLTLVSVSPAAPATQVTVDNSPAVVTIGDNDATTVSVAASDSTATETTATMVSSRFHCPVARLHRLAV